MERIAFPVHDGQLHGIQWAKEYIVIQVTMPTYEYTITLRGVEFFCANTVMEGNTIFDAVAQPARQVADLAQIMLDDLEPGYSNERTIQQAIEADLTFFLLTPSYGCTILALCTHVDGHRHDLA